MKKEKQDFFALYAVILATTGAAQWLISHRSVYDVYDDEWNIDIISLTQWYWLIGQTLLIKCSIIL